MNIGYMLDTLKNSKIFLIAFGVGILAIIGSILLVVTLNKDDRSTYVANAVDFQGTCDEGDWDKFVNGKSGWKIWDHENPCAIEVRYEGAPEPLDFILLNTGQGAFEAPDDPFLDTLPIPSTPYVFHSTGMYEGRYVDYFIYFENEEDFRNRVNGQMVISSTRNNESDPVLLANIPLDQSFTVLSGFDQCMQEEKSLLPWAEQCLSYEERGLGESPMANIDWEGINRQKDHEEAEATWQEERERAQADKRAADAKAKEEAEMQARHEQAEATWQEERERAQADKRAADAKAKEEAERRRRERLAQGSTSTGVRAQHAAQETIAIAACDASFLGIPAWYNGLATDSKCTISPDSDGSNGLSSFIWKIALNLVEAILRIVGYAAVGFIIYGGYKYMISAGSPDGMVAARKTILNAVVGLVISIAAVAIVRTISSGVGLG